MSKRNAGGVPQTFFLEIVIFGRKQPLKNTTSFSKISLKNAHQDFQELAEFVQRRFLNKLLLELPEKFPKRNLKECYKKLPKIFLKEFTTLIRIFLKIPIEIIVKEIDDEITKGITGGISKESNFLEELFSNCRTNDQRNI